MANRKLFAIKIDPVALTSVTLVRATGGNAALCGAVATPSVSALDTGFAPARALAEAFKVGVALDATTGTYIVVLDSVAASDVTRVDIVQNSVTTQSLPILDEVTVDPLRAAAGLLTTLLAAYSSAA